MDDANTRKQDERRRQRMLLRKTGEFLEHDVTGGKALANLGAGVWLEESDRRLRRSAEWFEHPHPKGRDLAGEPDFAAMKLTRAWHQFGPLLSDGTREAIRRFFLGRDFQSKYTSENHQLLFHTSRYLMAGAFRSEVFGRYGLTGAELEELELGWLKRCIRRRACYGWEEFDSLNYIPAVWECLTGLYDFAPDEELGRLAGMMLDVLLLDMAVDSLNGCYGGAHGRSQGEQALDHRKAGTYPLQHLYFGVGEDGRSCAVEALLSGYRPPRHVLEIALCRSEPYENRERKPLHASTYHAPQRPLPDEAGSIRKYTYWTPSYIMGCVQRQDRYEQPEAAWYAHHQQHQWDLTFPARPDARLFTHHPGAYGAEGAEHGYWTGDMGCGCGHFWQHRSALVALYHIPEEQPYGYIHAYVPKHAFDEVAEENGIVFVRIANAYAALRLMNGCAWTTEGEWSGRELISEGRRNAVICEAGTIAEYGGFDAFRKEISANRAVFDAERMTIAYHSRRAGLLELDLAGGRRLNGEEADLDYGTYDSPYLQSEWSSGVIRAVPPVPGSKSVIYDFITGEMREEVQS